MQAGRQSGGPAGSLTRSLVRDVLSACSLSESWEARSSRSLRPTAWQRSEEHSSSVTVGEEESAEGPGGEGDKGEGNGNVGGCTEASMAHSPVRWSLPTRDGRVMSPSRLSVLIFILLSSRHLSPLYSSPAFPPLLFMGSSLCPDTRRLYSLLMRNIVVSLSK